MARRWKSKGSKHFQPPLFFFSLPGGKGGKTTTVAPVGLGTSRYKRKDYGTYKAKTSGYQNRTTGAAVTARLRRLI